MGHSDVTVDKRTALLWVASAQQCLFVDPDISDRRNDIVIFRMSWRLTASIHAVITFQALL